jgi:hypothetical protein
VAKASQPALTTSTGPVSGAPVLIEFSRTLPAPTFERFVRLTFCRKENRFRLWGNPIQLGPQKYHVYGLDRHVWQPLFLEITDKHIVAVVPEGTCGNSIHRLVTNIQQYLDPAINVWIGDRPYDEMITADSSTGDLYETK